MPRSIPAARRTSPLLLALLLSINAIWAREVAAAECSNGPLSPCFDLNTLWLPAGRTSFLSMPDTQLTGPGQVAFGIASELLHQPISLRAASPDRDGRDIHVLDYAVDVSYFLALGLVRNLEASLLASIRAHQSGAGIGGIDSQSAPPLERNAVRDPRVGLAYSLDDALAAPGLGVRLGLDATLPFGDRNPFANERSFVVMPSTTIGFQYRALELRAEFGVRLRKPLDFAGTQLGNQAFFALGAALEVIQPGWLSLSAEAFGLPSLSSSRSSSASPRVSEARLFPAEWLAGVHSSFGERGPWTLTLACGSGIPISSETRDTSTGPQTSYFMGLTTPDFRSLLVVRFAATERAPSPH